MTVVAGATTLALREADARATACALLRRLGIADPRVPAESRNEPPPPRTVVLAPAQLDAVRRAIRIIDARGGVLLADRTGTGKTFLALALIEHALSTGSRRVLVAGPSALAAQWSPPLRKAARAHGARLIHCRGSRTEPTTSASTIGWLSHAMLSLGRWPPAVDACDLVLVDEAHAFRNPSTRRHRSLAWLCRSAKVVLLTATPINNSLMDLYYLFRLFIGDGELDDLGAPDLEAGAQYRQPELHPLRPRFRGNEQSRAGADRRWFQPREASACAPWQELAPRQNR
jgi:superfamily II DNA or RNA helicase